MLIAVGTNHKYSPIQIREKLIFPKRRLEEFLRKLSGEKRIESMVILSTCNRVELYANVQDTDLGISALKEFIAHYHQEPLDKIAPYLYTYIGKEVAIHLFEVAAGLDSQIIGENQILEQVEFAYKQAKAAGITDNILSSVFIKAIDTGIKVRKYTRISNGNISIASIAISFIRDKLGSLKDKKILLIGVGKISELAVRELKNEEAGVVFITNRTYERALELAGYINAQVVSFGNLKEKLKEADIIISATSSPHLILKKEDILEAIGNKPLLIIDLAVPRDVDPEIKHIKGIEFYDLDDLTPFIEKKLEERKKGIPKAEKIIQKEIENLCLTESLELEREPALLL